MLQRAAAVLVGALVATCAVSAALAAHAAQPVLVRSSLDGKRVLPVRIHWVAKPAVAAARVREVDFLIDGRLGWVEHKAPYVYANDGNWLVTSFLSPGKHRFTTRVITGSGARGEKTVIARVVAAPAPPAGIAGNWKRTMTAADAKKATSSQPPPPGVWKLHITAKGWAMTDPEGGGGLFDVVYRSAGKLQMRPTIETPPFPNPANGGFCDDTDPLWLWTETITGDGKSMELNPAGHDPCGDRTAILQGTWTRIG